MFKKLKIPALILGTALALLGPSAAQAREYEREHHHHRFSVFFGYTPRHYADGYYDRWGYWHPYRAGYYDRWGYWHPRY
jgi:hypothetical protein